MAGASNWVEKLQNMRRNAHKDIDVLMERQSNAGKDDIGLTGKNTGGVYVRKSGKVDIYSKDGLGITIDPDTESISLYASKINLYSKSIDLYTNPLSLKWNKFPINLTFVLMGSCAVGPVTTAPGTLMPYNAAAQDASSYISKSIGKLTSLGG